MAICLPGMASSVNLAATSEMRVAPLVMTTNWMTTMMMKMMTPTASEPPATKLAKVRITSPAACMAESGSPARSPTLRMSLVVATFSTRRSSVVASSSDGKTENSSGE